MTKELPVVTEHQFIQVWVWFSGTDSSIAMAAPQQNPTMNWNARNFHEEWKQFEQHTTLMFNPLLGANMTVCLLPVGRKIQEGKEFFGLVSKNTIS